MNNISDCRGGGDDGDPRHCTSTATTRTMNDVDGGGEEEGGRGTKKRHHCNESGTEAENPIGHNKKARVNVQSNTAHDDDDNVQSNTAHDDDDNVCDNDTTVEASETAAATTGIVGNIDEESGGKQLDLLARCNENLPFTFPSFETLKELVTVIVPNVSGTKRRFEQTLGTNRIDFFKTAILGQELLQLINDPPAGFKDQLPHLWRDDEKDSWANKTGLKNKTYAQLVDLLLAMAVALTVCDKDRCVVANMADEFVAFFALNVCSDEGALEDKNKFRQNYHNAVHGLSINERAVAEWDKMSFNPKDSENGLSGKELEELSKEELEKRRMKLGMKKRRRAIELTLGAILHDIQGWWDFPSLLNKLWKKQDFDKEESATMDSRLNKYVNKIYNPISARKLERENGVAKLSLHHQKVLLMGPTDHPTEPNKLKFLLDLIEKHFNNNNNNSPICNDRLRCYLAEVYRKYPCALTEERYSRHLHSSYLKSKFCHRANIDGDILPSNETSDMTEFSLALMNLMFEDEQMGVDEYIDAICAIYFTFPPCRDVLHELQRLSIVYPKELSGSLQRGADEYLPGVVPSPFTPQNFALANAPDESLTAFQKAGSGKYLDPYDFVCVEFLGKGTFQYVFRAYSKRYHTHVALKVPRLRRQDQLGMIERFFEHTAKLEDFSIIRPLGFFLLPNTKKGSGAGKKGAPLVVIEQLGIRDLESLRDEVNANEELNFSPKMGSDEVQRICRKRMEVFAKPILQILQATAHAHVRGVIIRDIKTENIMEKRDTPDGESRWALSDNGEVKNSNSGFATLNVGTTAYLAPEADESKSYEKTDNFAVGTIIYELLTGSIRSHDGGFQKIVSDTWFDMDVEDDIPEFDKHRKNIFKYEVVDAATGERVSIGRKIRTLIEGLLEEEEDKRISVADALKQWKKIIVLHDPQWKEIVDLHDAQIFAA